MSEKEEIMKVLKIIGYSEFINSDKKIEIYKSAPLGQFTDVSFSINSIECFTHHKKHNQITKIWVKNVYNRILKIIREWLVSEGYNLQEEMKIHLRSVSEGLI